MTICHEQPESSSASSSACSACCSAGGPSPLLQHTSQMHELSVAADTCRKVAVCFKLVCAGSSGRTCTRWRPAGNLDGRNRYQPCTDCTVMLGWSSHLPVWIQRKGPASPYLAQSQPHSRWNLCNFLTCSVHRNSLVDALACHSKCPCALLLGI